MCAIAGFCRPCSLKFCNKTKWKRVLSLMNKIQQHRGPDGKGFFLQPDCGLTHARLSIIDLKNGSQPMTVSLGNRALTIVFNGEIYNYKELQEELKNKGINFKTNSDTEVILMGHLVYGEKFVEKLDGIFAYAIWDEDLKTLFLFRDRLGVKPLFFIRFDGNLVFSSEIKGIFQFPGIKPQVDRSGLCEIFGLGPARTPGKAVFKDISEVKPGYYIKFNMFEFKQKQYWKLQSFKHTDSLNETIEKTRYLVKNAILKQTISDVPLCTFLSGGVDSSIITSICADKFLKNNNILKTFSFDFVENDYFFKPNSFQPSQDRPWVDKMVNFLHTDHSYLECTTENLVSGLFKAVDAADLPCMVDIEGSLLYFCSEVAKTNKVTLTGECADEIFGGYPWFYRPELLNVKTFPWSTNLNHRILLLRDEIVYNLKIEKYVQNAYKSTILDVPKLDSENEVDCRQRKLFYLNIKWFMQTLLNRMDRASMYYGLEARVPFADHKLVEYLFNVPWKFKYCGNIEKGLLRKAAVSFLPKEVVYRKKSPYPKIYNPKFEENLKNLVLEEICEDKAPILELISKEKLKKFIYTPFSYNKPWYGQLMAGPQMLAYILQINYWFEKYKIDIVY